MPSAKNRIIGERRVEIATSITAPYTIRLKLFGHIGREIRVPTSISRHQSFCRGRGDEGTTIFG